VRLLVRKTLIATEGLLNFISSETALFKASTSDGPLRLHEVLGFAKYRRCDDTRGKVVLLTVVREVRPPQYPVPCCGIRSIWFCGQFLYSSDRSHPVVFFNIHEVFYSVTTQHQYIVNNIEFWLHVSVYQTIIRPIFIKWRYIQCVRTLWDPILFTLIKSKNLTSF
jgi:hypothetical protein